MIEIVILLAIPEVLKSLTDGSVRKRTDPETVERLPATEIRIEVSENQLSLTSGISCYDNALTAVKQLADNFYLGKHTCIWLDVYKRQALWSADIGVFVFPLFQVTRFQEFSYQSQKPLIVDAVSYTHLI